MPKKITLLSLALLSMPMLQLYGQCITAGPNNPTSAVNNTDIGSIAWSAPTNALTANNVTTTAGTLIIGNVTNYLVVTGYNFAIPSTAVICGITVRIEKGGTGLLQTVDDNSVRIVKDGAIIGTNKATGTNWIAPDVVSDYGGTGDLWGTTWTPAQINAANFGVAIAADLTSLSAVPTASIDVVQISVHYDITMPIDLLNFEGNYGEEKVKLSWTVASQMHNDFFTIEKSTDGISFETVGTVDGVINSSEILNYELEDDHVFNGITYYRLSQTDLNGYVLVFEPISIDCRKQEDLAVYPNPSNGQVTIAFKHSEVENYTLTIFDQSGKPVMQLDNLTSGQVMLENDALVNGLYFAQLRSETEIISSQKLVIVD